MKSALDLARRYLKLADRDIVAFNPNNSLENATYLPLCKRGRACEGAEGDFCVRTAFKSPLTPLFQRGKYTVIVQFTANEQSGFNPNNPSGAIYPRRGRDGEGEETWLFQCSTPILTFPLQGGRNEYGSNGLFGFNKMSCQP